MILFCCKDISRSLLEITSKHNDDHYFMNSLHSFRTESKLKSHENMCKNHAYCYEEYCQTS